MGAIDFTSRVPRHKRQALERLLFFNGCQDRVARDIVDAIDRYGPPEIFDDEDGLRVRLASMPDAQALFAVERDSNRPIGVAVYIRADLEHVTVVHLGVAEDYCAGGINESENMPLRLVREVKRSSRRLKGVRRLEVAYCTQRSRVHSGTY
ncbi:MAG: hypothetical protein ACR2I8_00300 [Steroidobacteraceae bacterium]